MVHFILAKFFAIENERVWHLIEGICTIHPFLPKVALRLLSALHVIISHSPFLKSRYWKQDYQGACGHLKSSLKRVFQLWIEWKKCDQCTWTFLGTYKKPAVMWGFVVTIFQVAQPAFPITPLSQGLSTGWPNHKCDSHPRHWELSVSLLPNHLNRVHSETTLSSEFLKHTGCTNTKHNSSCELCWWDMWAIERELISVQSFLVWKVWLKTKHRRNF